MQRLEEGEHRTGARPALASAAAHCSAEFWSWPVPGALLVENEGSEARDHCANERTFLSYVKLSVYMAVVSLAITTSFHLKTRPSALEVRMALPLGIVFWLLAVACLLLGLMNYVGTVQQYSSKAAIVQTGWKTQMIMSFVATAIMATCLLLIVVEKMQTSEDGS